MTLISRRSLCLALPALALTSSPLVAKSTLRRPNFGDNDPVNFSGDKPSRYRVHGIDVARFQEDINWRTAAHGGVSFAFIKATEGGDLLDPEFRHNWRAAARAGIPRGAYHFYYFCTDAATQAKWFIRNVPRTKGALPPVLDMEWNAFSPTCKLRPSGKIVRREMRIYLNTVERHFGQRPLIYTTPGFYKDAGLHRLKGEEFWLRSTAKTPAQAFPKQAWKFWQYSGTGVVPGIEKETDLNVFGGNPKQWDAWVAKRSQ